MANIEDLRNVRTEAAIRNTFMNLVAEVPVWLVSASAASRHQPQRVLLHHASVAALYAALVGFVQRWVADTDRPLANSLRRFRELHAGTSSAAADYLLGTSV